MSKFKVYEPPKLTISSDEYIHLLSEHKAVLEDYGKLIEKYYQLNEEYAGYKKFVKPGELSDE